MYRYVLCYLCAKICVETVQFYFTRTPGLASICGKMTRRRTGLFTEKPTGLLSFRSSRNEGQRPGDAPLESKFNLRSRLAADASRENVSIFVACSPLPGSFRDPGKRDGTEFLLQNTPRHPRSRTASAPSRGKARPPGGDTGRWGEWRRQCQGHAAFLRAAEQIHVHAFSSCRAEAARKRSITPPPSRARRGS